MYHPDKRYTPRRSVEMEKSHQCTRSGVPFSLLVTISASKCLTMRQKVAVVKLDGRANNPGKPFPSSSAAVLWQKAPQGHRRTEKEPWFTSRPALVMFLYCLTTLNSTVLLSCKVEEFGSTIKRNTQNSYGHCEQVGISVTVICYQDSSIYSVNSSVHLFAIHLLPVRSFLASLLVVELLQNCSGANAEKNLTGYIRNERKITIWVCCS